MAERDRITRWDREDIGPAESREAVGEDEAEASGPEASPETVSTAADTAATDRDAASDKA